MNQCTRLALSLKAFANLRPVNEMKRATVGLISILGNIRSVRIFHSNHGHDKTESENIIIVII